jgi:3D (Asp-Asp-Asp) domain-containing protein
LTSGDRVHATVTFYYCEDTTGGARPGDGGGFCGTMRDGSVVYPGAAACDSAYLGQKFRIEGDPTERVYTCADTGGAIHGEHRDIWFLGNAEGWAWQRVVGTSAVIEILQ